MKILKSKKMKIVTAVSVTLFSLLTCFTGVFAWFVVTGIANNESSNFNVITDPNIMNFELSLYKYDYDEKAGYRLYENDPDFTFMLNKYDKFLTERNTNNNNILRFELSFTHTLSSEQNRKVNFDFKCTPTGIGEKFDNGIKDTKDRRHIDAEGYKYSCESINYICNKISNVIYFKVLPYTYIKNGSTYKFDTSINIDETNPANTYANATSAFANVTGKSFVNNKTKSTKITDNSIIVDPAATGMVLYIEYSYVPSLVEDFLYPNEFVESPETAEIFIGGVNIEFFKDVLGLYVTSEAVDS